MAGKWINIGWSQINITPDRPVFNMGQMYLRVSQYVHDPITATALVLDNDVEQAVFISCDMVGVPDSSFAKMREKLEGMEGLNITKISINATHTHNSTTFEDHHRTGANERILGNDILPMEEIPDNIFTGEEATNFLTEKLTELITKAWETRKPGGISYAQDYAAVAFNRRPVFENENGERKTVMYGVCAQKSFKGFEGGSDHTADMLYTWDLDGNVTGVMVNIPCPSQVFELHCFTTADYWAFARRAIRERLGRNVFVLPVCGAAGDQNPLDLVRLSKDNTKTLPIWGGQTREVFRNFDMALECEAIGDRIAEAVARGYKKASNYIETNPVFKHEVVKMSLPLRMVTEEDYKEAAKNLENMKSNFSSEHRMIWKDVVAAFEPVGVIARWELQQEKQTFDFDMHVVRIGNISIATNPFELFTEYGMRIKARSKSEQTFIIQLANAGGAGYLPTPAALAGGSYSSKPASTKCGPEGGDLLVERTLDIIDKMW